MLQIWLGFGQSNKGTGLACKYEVNIEAGVFMETIDIYVAFANGWAYFLRVFPWIRLLVVRRQHFAENYEFERFVLGLI
ncbi:unnamed protein product [Cuscuta campestris]|uniref:Uncharacterized protein n=1 Tax=Cuscuta campestris TaxID=132261 RepID=A0A484LHV4_9ASTE|nr:unnamed protein product [Cuscuta campestris]